MSVLCVTPHSTGFAGVNWFECFVVVVTPSVDCDAGDNGVTPFNPILAGVTGVLVCDLRRVFCFTAPTSVTISGGATSLFCTDGSSLLDIRLLVTPSKGKLNSLVSGSHPSGPVLRTGMASSFSVNLGGLSDIPCEPSQSSFTIMPMIFSSSASNESIIFSRSASLVSLFNCSGVSGLLFLCLLIMDCAWALVLVADGPLALGHIFWQCFFFGDGDLLGSSPSFNMA